MNFRREGDNLNSFDVNQHAVKMRAPAGAVPLFFSGFPDKLL
jgi:hypothetical protein